MGNKESGKPAGGSGHHPAEPSKSDPYLTWLEDEIRAGKANLRERLKELECLFSVDRALRRADHEWRTSLQSVVDTLPSGFRLPDRTSVRVRWGQEEFRSKGFESSRLRLAQPLSGGGELLGEIEACLVASPSEETTTSFAPEEISLLSGVGDRLVEALGRRQAEAELRENEEFVQSLVRSSPIPLVTMDAQGNVLSWNPAAERTLGWATHEVVGRPPPIWPGDRREELDELLRRALTGESLSGLPVVSLRHDGSAIEICLSVAPVQDRAGGVKAILFAVQDVSDPAGAWERNRFQARLLDAVGQAIVATDLDGTITYWNRAAQKLYGWDSSEALGRHFMDLVPIVLSAAQAEELMGTLRRGDTWTGEFAATLKDGSTLKVLVSSAPLQSEGDLVGVIGTSSDVSILKNLEAQVRQSQKMEALGRLAGGIAHDFNNILTVIHGHSELLLVEHSEDPGLQSDIQEILDAARRATRLTRPLLALSRQQVQDLRVQDMRESVRRMEFMLRRLVPSRIELSFGLPGEAEWIRADDSQLDQVIMNLVVNAVDAVSGTGTVRVSVDRCEVSQEQVESTPWEAAPGVYCCLTVADTGVGMPPENVERIFEPFFTTKSPEEGTGLGLSTVFGIVRQAGGYIVVNTAPGQGTTFEVRWPRVEAPEKASDPATGVGIHAGDRPRGSRRNEVVLVVDDAPSVRNLVTRVLEQAGYRVLSANDGEEAFRMAEAQYPDLALVISDVIMPIMGGADLLHRLGLSFPRLPIVLMSGHADREVGRDLRALAAGFLSKPFGLQDLIQVVEAAISD